MTNRSEKHEKKKNTNREKEHAAVASRANSVHACNVTRSIIRRRGGRKGRKSSRAAVNGVVEGGGGGDYNSSTDIEILLQP